MELRIANKNDLEYFKKIKRSFNEDYGISEKDEGFILEEFNGYLKKGAIMVAYEGNEIVGYLCGLIEEDMYEKTGYIGEVFVLPSFRGKGISNSLKDKFIEFLKSRGINICRIDVNPDNSAQEVYKKWGFKIDKYRMSLKL